MHQVVQGWYRGRSRTPPRQGREKGGGGGGGRGGKRTVLYQAAAELFLVI